MLSNDLNLKKILNLKNFKKNAIHLNKDELRFLINQSTKNYSGSNPRMMKNFP